MAWKDLISGSFAFGTAPFAAHPADLDFASQAVRGARKSMLTAPGMCVVHETVGRGSKRKMLRPPYEID